MSARRRRTQDLVLSALSDQSRGLTRAELGRITGLSASAISDCVAAMRSEGLVVESAPTLRSVSGRGRPAAVITLAGREGVVLGIDFGHAHVSVAVATAEGQILERSQQELDVDHRAAEALDLGARLAREAVRDCGRAMSDVVGVAAGIPGPLDTATHLVRSPTILADWVGLAPAAELQRRLGHPVFVDNDANMGARGEQASGAARGLEDFVYVKVSHGIGAAIVMSGRVYVGSCGIAGEIGHTQIPGAAQWCRCGSRGCLEAVVSSDSVRRQLAVVLATHRGAPAEFTVPPLPDLADNPAAARVLTEAGRTVGRVLADVVNCLNPAAVVLGGELGAAGEPFAGGVRESVSRFAQPASAQAVEVVTGQLGADAELLGALAASVARSRRRSGHDPGQPEVS